MSHSHVAPIFRVALVAMLAALAPQSPSQAQATKPAATVLPDTPAGRMFGAWLATVNSGDRDAMKQFVAQNFAPPPNGTPAVDQNSSQDLDLFNASGGMAFKAVLGADDRRISVVVQDNNTGYSREVRMSLTSDDPPHVAGIGMRFLPTPAELLPRTPLADKEISDHADRLISTLTAADKFSGLLYVARGDRPIYSRAVGLASRQWNQPNRIDTKFNVASIGKMFTAVSIAQFVEQGKLSYTDTLTDVLPSYPDKTLGAKITVDQLLSHTSGLTNPGTATGDALRATFLRGFLKVDQYLSKDPVDSLKFEPGSKIEYNNYGYMLLGAIIEKASGEDFFDYVRSHIFKPAGMNDTDYYELDTEPSNLAMGYMDAPGGRRSNIFTLSIKGNPAGGAYATAADLVKFSLALRNHTLLSASSLEKVWTGKKDYIGRGKYGYGCVVAEYNGQKTVSHGGGWTGVTNWFEMIPGLDYTVVVLTNIDSDPNPIAYKLREWLTQGR